MDKVYVIVEETDIWGAWSTPEAAVKWYFRRGLNDAQDYITEPIGPQKDQTVSVKIKTKEMLDPHSDYPAIEEIDINPEHPWTIDR